MFPAGTVLTDRLSGSLFWSLIGGALRASFIIVIIFSPPNEIIIIDVLHTSAKKCEKNYGNEGS